MDEYTYRNIIISQAARIAELERQVALYLEGKHKAEDRCRELEEKNGLS